MIFGAGSLTRPWPALLGRGEACQRDGQLLARRAEGAGRRPAKRHRAEAGFGEALEQYRRRRFVARQARHRA